jgi:hypothetical protein
MLWRAIKRRLERRVIATSERLVRKVLLFTTPHFPALPADVAPSPESPLRVRRRLLFYVTVGQGISIWAKMEEVLVGLAADLMGTTAEKAGLVFYNIMNFHVWLTIIDELLISDERAQDLRSQWAPVAQRLRELNDTRVRLAHHSVQEIGEEYEPLLVANPLDTRSKSRKQLPLLVNDVVTFTERVQKLALDDLPKLKSAVESALSTPP